MEIAEDTYAEIAAAGGPSGRLRKVTLYVDRTLRALQAAAPGAGFDRFDDPDADAYRLTNEAPTLRFVADDLDAATPLPVPYRRVDLRLPTPAAYAAAVGAKLGYDVRIGRSSEYKSI